MADYNSRLCEAALEGNKAKVKYYLEKGAHPNWAMDYAISSGNVDIVKVMLEHGANPNSAVIAAVCSGGNVDIVKVTLEHGANPNKVVKQVLILPDNYTLSKRFGHETDTHANYIGSQQSSVKDNCVERSNNTKLKNA
ncbi:putative ankyrin repeat protein RF_0950 [Argopecten irradians]|uniref:putative ankyrin repeat protein RF_0950 n=1 Tax=Argopecten irradians TaxID=31199 RepID=UPI003715DA46